MKNADDCMQMVVLGVCFTIVVESAKLLIQLDEQKAERWAKELMEYEKQGDLPQSIASKFAGRLSFAASGTSDRTGRTYIKAFYAQAAAPCTGITPMMAMSLRWWLGYLHLRPATEMNAEKLRPTIRSWTDASGVERGLAAVVTFNGQTHYTHMVLPQYVWDQLNERNDHQIGVQEMIAVILCQHTFSDTLQGARWLLWVDNRGVIRSIVKGALKAQEISLCVSRMWMQCAKSGTSLHVWYVQSAANIADGPSRLSFRQMKRLRAVWRPPVLPDWLKDIWSPMDFRR